MASPQSVIKLNTGAEFPVVGFGTWKVEDGEEQEKTVLQALKAGYRHIDTAAVYGTEEAVGKAIKQSGIPRNEIFLTTKIWNNAHHPDDVEPALDASLKALDTDYVDLWLMHFPVSFKRGDKKFPYVDGVAEIETDWDYLDTWKAMEKVFKNTSKARAIGISNFSKAETERVLSEGTVIPACHQIELHPYLIQKDFVEFNQSKGIQLAGYSPFADTNSIYDKGKQVPPLLKHEVLKKIGEKYNKSSAQVALAWGINKGWAVLPKSGHEERMKQNLDTVFKLKDEEIKEIDALDVKFRFNDSTKPFNYNLYADLDGKD